jgi:basic membrane lipoprotein Med (substrate-binding protein (PBP1-ABC) superfamily)
MAAELRRRREELGLSLGGLSELSGVSKAMIGKIEAGGTSPTAGLLGRLCAGLGITLSALMAAAEEYPDVKFIQIGGIADNGKNIVSYVFQPGEGGYAAGILAGLMVESGKLGGVGAVEIPTIAADYTAFMAAAQKVNPNVTDVPVAYTGSWVDIPKAKEAAIAQIDSGIELILANGDNANVGAIEAAAEHGSTYVIGWTRDQSHLAPELVLTSNEQRVDNILVDAITAIQDGTIEWANHIVGFADGAQTFAPYADAVPAEVAQEVDNVIQALADGRIVLDDNGNVVTDEYHQE